MTQPTLCVLRPTLHWQGILWGKKLIAQENLFPFLKIILNFVGFPMVKIHFFQKVLKNDLDSELLYFFHFLTLMVKTQKWKIPIFLTFPFSDINSFFWWYVSLLSFIIPIIFMIIFISVVRINLDQGSLLKYNKCQISSFYLILYLQVILSIK